MEDPMANITRCNPFDDLERPAHDVLMDDDRTKPGPDPDLR